MRKYLCTNCSYVYNPFMGDDYASFEELDESWACPHCGDSIDGFIELPTNIQEIGSRESLTEQELSHIPYYHRTDNSIIVSVGADSCPHPMEDGHFLEYIGIFDEDGDVVDIHIRPEENTAVFDDDELDSFEVRAGCNIHGTWRWVETYQHE